MIELHPLPHTDFLCPNDNHKLEAIGWYMPGMRTLADLRCKKCNRQFYGDLSAGHGLYYPCLVDQQTGEVFEVIEGSGYHKQWITESFKNRSSNPININILSLQTITHIPLILNCVDKLYGHALLKLLNAQHYIDNRPELDVIVIVQPFLEWLVPEGVAEIWVVDIPLRQGAEWNDSLAEEIQGLVRRFDRVYLSVAFSHPHPDDYDIQRFSRIQPFSEAMWDFDDKPTVTFIWREDRLWDTLSLNIFGTRIEKRIKYKLYSFLRWRQHKHVIKLGNLLRQHYSNLRFIVVGIGNKSNFPTWIEDLRETQINKEIEQQWCHTYATSHVVVGIHGSNMLLPSGHAGSVVELLPPKRGNIMQDILLQPSDARVSIAHTRLIPTTAGVSSIADAILIILKHHRDIIQKMPRSACDHEKTDIHNLKYIGRSNATQKHN